MAPRNQKELLPNLYKEHLLKFLSNMGSATIAFQLNLEIKRTSGAIPSFKYNSRYFFCIFYCNDHLRSNEC